MLSSQVLSYSDAAPLSLPGTVTSGMKTQSVFVYLYLMNMVVCLFLRLFEVVLLHQLLVIGNGFDLACGLKSSFADFFAPRIEAILKKSAVEGSSVCTAQMLASATNDLGYTVWDLVVIRRNRDLSAVGKGTLWADFESMIEQRLIMRSSRAGLPKRNLIDQIADDITNRFSSGSSSITKGKVLNAEAAYLANMLGHRSISNEEAHRFYYDELKRLEGQFLDYLKAEVVESRADYLNRAQHLLDMLIGQSGSESSSSESTISLLNFNYTDPTMGYRNVNSTNIHGSLRLGEVVMGIDGRELIDVDRTMPFTKTYRLMTLPPLKSGALVQSSDYLGGKTTVIKFFGHSLAKADYSYFQALFDGLNLYSGTIRLMFYCRDYRNADGAIIHTKERTVSAVKDLLTEYSWTLDNRDHGRNLIHKLLIEGRLSIVELPFEQNVEC